jgi:hypothetical protein
LKQAGVGDVAAVGAAGSSEPPLRRDPQRPVIGRRCDVDGPTHQRALDELTLRKRTVKARRVETGEPRPQPDVRRGGFLRLQRGDGFDRRDDVEDRRLEKQLPRERRPAKPPRAQDRAASRDRHSRGSFPARNAAINSV